MLNDGIAPAQHRGEGEMQAALNKTHQGLWSHCFVGAIKVRASVTWAHPHPCLSGIVTPADAHGRAFKKPQLHKDWNMEWGPVQMDEAAGRTQLNKTACRVWFFTKYFHSVGLKAEV